MAKKEKEAEKVEVPNVEKPKAAPKAFKEYVTRPERVDKLKLKGYAFVRELSTGMILMRKEK